MDDLTIEGFKYLERRGNEGSAYLICILAALTLLGCGGPSYEVRPDRMSDVARYKGTSLHQSTIPPNWYSFSLDYVDGKRAKGPFIESGEHVVVLRCVGNEDYVKYEAHVQAQVDFLPNTNYVVNGRITPDRIFMWIEREDTKEKVTPEIRGWRHDDVQSASFFPSYVPKK